MSHFIPPTPDTQDYCGMDTLVSIISHIYTRNTAMHETHKNSWWVLPFSLSTLTKQPWQNHLYC